MYLQAFGPKQSMETEKRQGTHAGGVGGGEKQKNL